jgi:hypothetical protein
VACDFFAVETIWLKTLHVLFFIQLSTRRVVATEVTAHPDTAWVTQQARPKLRRAVRANRVLGCGNGLIRLDRCRY